MSRPWRLAAVFLLFAFYLSGLTAIGLVGPDEPRYAMVAREMAQSGDWLTPRLEGAAWFEKPALEYWGQALAFKLGLGDDLSPRLFNALAGAGFLVFFWRLLRRRFSEDLAWTASLILATTVGWIAESRIAVMDLPLAAALGAAMLLAMDGAIVVAGAMLGVAVLAKGLVPLVLVVPALWFCRAQWRQFGYAAAALVAVAGPWYVLMTLRHGRVFIDEFFIKHHFSRFTETALQHVQPAWFYLPVLLGMMFPWTPLVAMLRRPKTDQEKFLWGWLLWGLLFFSVSRNKLPGYILPLLPPLAVLCALALAESKRSWAWLAACGALLGLTPALITVLPEALASGLSRASWQLPVAPMVMLAIGAAGVAAWRGTAAVALTCLMCLGLVMFRVAPAVDERASARALSQIVGGHAGEVCVDSLHRAWRYQLDYYLHRTLPDCAKQPRRLRLSQRGSEPPALSVGPALE